MFMELDGKESCSVYVDVEVESSEEVENGVESEEVVRGSECTGEAGGEALLVLDVVLGIALVVALTEFTDFVVEVVVEVVEIE